MTGKRVDYITWDEYFMGVALLSGRRSKDQVQVGACIVSQDNKILSMGYNGSQRCSDDEFPWGKENEKEDPYNSKYFYSTHSELNAILNYRGEAWRKQALCRPCSRNECAKPYTVRNQDHCIQRRQICGHTGGNGFQAYAECCGSAVTTSTSPPAIKSS